MPSWEAMQYRLMRAKRDPLGEFAQYRRPSSTRRLFQRYHPETPPTAATKTTPLSQWPLVKRHRPMPAAIAAMSSTALRMRIGFVNGLTIGGRPAGCPELVA